MAAPAATPAPAAVPVPLDQDAVPVRYLAGRSGGTFTLRFEWPVPVSAAIYRRGGYVWAVFDRVEKLDLRAARRAGGDQTASLQQVPLPLGSAARFRVGTGLYPKVSRQGNVWIVQVSRKRAIPAKEIKVLAQPRAPVEPRVLLPVRGAVDPLVMVDDGLSETVYVVPLRGSGLGVGSDRVFPEFRLITTAQGIVIRALADDVLIRRIREGVQITSVKGLVLSGRESERKDVRWPGDKAASPRLIDVPAWRAFGKNFRVTKQRLQNEVAAATESERGRQRLVLGQYLFAHGFYSDALGTLTLARQQDAIGKEAAFNLLLGAAALQVNDLRQAGQALLDPGLNGNAEAALWRGALRSTQLDWEAAAENFAGGRALLRFYLEPFRSNFVLMATRASLKNGKPAEAMEFLDLLTAGKPTRAQLSEGDYLRGVALRARKELDAALVQWEKVIKDSKPPIRIEAEVERIEVLFEQQKISRAEAVIKLEDLRFAWRGDDVEFRVLRRLAAHYLAEKRYRLALSNMRRAAEFYPNHPEYGALRRDLRKAFLDIFLEGGADELAPVTALGIYDEFQELTPADSRGDIIVERLAERLVSVDLLESAAKLLERQIDRRLKGVDRSRAGARLAAVRLMDRQPTEALMSLDRTKFSKLPEDLIMERNRLRARALSDLGRQDEALDVIGSDPGPETDLVRSAIYWRLQNWPGAAKALGRVANQLLIQDGRLGDENAKLILSWATALALSGDHKGLLVLRRRFDHLMEESPYRDAYRVVANEADGEVADYPSLVAKVREVAHYEGFLSSYRDRLKRPAPPGATP
ncbi:MAG: hypothetical protein QNJ94_06140 [Alphaproteobacteria bacterium]|nr:hypothetical protein [Alphaproteobacteria bacterium]